MEENFNLLAQSRANYYTQGSPVQFVRVEMLKGEVSGQIAVCLTFKNIGAEKMSGLVIHFKCKNRQGEHIFEDRFFYENLQAGQGDLFGSDDAVYVSDEPVGSVDVEMGKMVLDNGREVNLSGCKRTRLPAPRPLPENLCAALRQRTGKEELTFVPQVIEQGWYCACGAFHPKAENTVYCSECGSDRILLQNALSGMLQQAKAEAERAKADASEGGTRVLDGEAVQEAAQEYGSAPTASEPTAMYSPAHAASEEEEEKETRVYRSGNAKPVQRAEEPEEEEAEYEDEEISSDDELAARIIRWAPPITVILCALVVAFTVVYHVVLQ